MSELSDAVKILTQELAKDEGYFYSWEANIAMAFRDEWNRSVEKNGYPYTSLNIHVIANKAANNFLNQLCKGVTNE